MCVEGERVTLTSKSPVQSPRHLNGCSRLPTSRKAVLRADPVPPADPQSLLSGLHLLRPMLFSTATSPVSWTGVAHAWPGFVCIVKTTLATSRLHLFPDKPTTVGCCMWPM